MVKWKNEFLSFKKVKVNSNDQPWVTGDFLELISLRQYHFYHNNDSEFKKVRNLVNRERKTLKVRYYGKKMENLKKENPRAWWQNVKEITGDKNASNPIQNMANSLFDGDLKLILPLGTSART